MRNITRVITVTQTIEKQDVVTKEGIISINENRELKYMRVEISGYNLQGAKIENTTFQIINEHYSLLYDQDIPLTTSTLDEKIWHIIDLIRGESTTA